MSKKVTSRVKPSAYITVQKNRTKKGSDVYLNDDTEFEIELFNPKQIPVLAKISINNNDISDSGIVLRPSERVFLERYLNDSKKFKFKTYNVSGTKEEIEYAIKNNGLIRVSFYNEVTYNQTISTGTCNQPIWEYHDPIVYGTYTGNVNLNQIFCSDQSFNIDVENNNAISLSTNINKKETGRIEKGSNSNQKFETVDMSFEYVPCTIVEYKLFPISKKVHKSNDINVSYCTNCRYRKRKSAWKFCPKCAEPFE